MTAHDSVALGQGSVADRAKTVSIGQAGNERQLVNLRAGTKDTDAVNLSQLKPVVEALGGDAAINADGSVRGPNYKIDGQSFNDVGHALTNLDERAKANTQSITTLDGRVTNVEGDVKSIRIDVDDLGTRLDNGATGLVRQDPASLAISIGANKGGASVSLAGTDGTRVLTGLSNGVDDTDAVTIAQLKATGLIDPNGKQLGALVYDDLTLARATLGGVGGTLLANVAPGLIAAGSLEAVNGGQLFTMQQKIDLLDTRLTNFENDKPTAHRPAATTATTSRSSATAPAQRDRTRLHSGRTRRHPGTTVSRSATTRRHRATTRSRSATTPSPIATTRSPSAHPRSGRSPTSRPARADRCRERAAVARPDRQRA